MCRMHYISDHPGTPNFCARILDLAELESVPNATPLDYWERNTLR